LFIFILFYVSVLLFRRFCFKRN